jgi:hypothetical protein
MARMMATSAMAMELLAAAPSFAGEPVRLSQSDLDNVTAGWVSDDANAPYRVFFPLEGPWVPALGEPDDDIWDLLGSGVVSQIRLLRQFFGSLPTTPFRPER